MIGFLFLVLMAVFNIVCAVHNKNEQDYNCSIAHAFLAGAFVILAVIHAVNSWKVAP